jgi:hypothetical protein
VFQNLVSHNPDLESLVKKGYAVAFDSTGHLVVRDIPYLEEAGDLKWGAIVTKLEFVDLEHVKQNDHQVFFAGSVPHGLDGQPIPNLAGGITNVHLSGRSGDVVVERSFSNKPRVAQAFRDFFEKIESYATIISGPAIEKFDVSPLTFRAVLDEEEADPVFKFYDTLTSRAEIGNYAARLEDEVVAIIGLGGTGSFILDFMARSRVKEIRGFDGDSFHVHNAFRAPGKTTSGEFGKPKARVLAGRYEDFRREIKLHNRYIDDTCDDEFAGVTFAFVCVDKGSARATIVNLLIRLQIPFIDVGLGLNRKPDGLTGLVRTTFFPVEKAAPMRDSGLVELQDQPDDVYHSNIQISELNALNAAVAVIKYKQLRGFYGQTLPEEHNLFNVAELKSYSEGVL